MKETQQEEIVDNMKHRYKNGMSYDEFETTYDEFVQDYYNIDDMNEYGCISIVGFDLKAYLEMEEVVRNYCLELTGEEYTKYGLVNIVPLWQLAICDEWKNENLKKLYEELSQTI